MLHQYSSITRRPAQLIGEIIDSSYALQLIHGFKKQFPGEVSKVFIETATIFNVVKDLANVSGIRFMYGMESANDPASKIILLIPCSNTPVSGSIPNTIVQPQGYFDHNGERVSLKRTWELLYNHAIHYSTLLPGMKFNKIVRGAFFGIDSLRALLTEYTTAHGLYYHFGLDNDIDDQSWQHKSVLEPLQENGTSYAVYFDTSVPCPPAVCDGNGDDSCPVTNMVNAGVSIDAEQKKELDIYRAFRDNYFLFNADNGPLVEMYYYVSPALKEAILDTGKATEIYTALYNNQVQQCNVLIGEGKYEAAKVLFEQTMENLMKTYLFR